jgi:hypothetical protein
MVLLHTPTNRSTQSGDRKHPTDGAITPSRLYTAAARLDCRIFLYFYVYLTRSGHELFQIDPSRSYTDHPRFRQEENTDTKSCFSYVNLLSGCGPRGLDIHLEIAKIILLCSINSRCSYNPESVSSQWFNLSNISRLRLTPSATIQHRHSRYT